MRAGKARKLYLRTFGNYRKMGAVTHCLFWHGHLYLEWAADMGVPFGIFTEGSVEKDNKSLKRVNSHHSRWDSEDHKTHDILFGLWWRSVRVQLAVLCAIQGRPNNGFNRTTDYDPNSSTHG